MEMHNHTPVSLFPPPPSKLSVFRATPGAGGNSRPRVFSVLSFPPHLRPCSRVPRWCSFLEGRSSRKPRRPWAEFSAQLLASHQSTRYMFQDSASAVRGGFLEQPGLRTCLHRLRPWQRKTWPADSFAKEEFYFIESSEQKGFWCWLLRSETTGMDRGLRHKRVGAWTQWTQLESAKKGASWPYASCVSRKTSWFTRPREKMGYRGLPRTGIFSAGKDQLTGSKSAETLGEGHGAKAHNQF